MQPVEPYSDRPLSDDALSAHASVSRPFTPGHRLLRSLNDRERVLATQRTAEALTAWTGRIVSADSLEILRATPKAQTYLFQHKSMSLIVKRHGQLLHYAQEMIACMLLSGHAPVPMLLADLELSRILITEFIPKTFAVSDLPSLVQVVRSLAELHASAALRDISTKTIFPNRTLSDLQHSSGSEFLPAYIVDRAAYQKLLECMITFHGGTYLPFALSDLKSEHLMKKDDRCVFIDLETLRPGVPEFIDLVSVINLIPPDASLKLDWSALLHEYRLHRADFEEAMSVDLLHHCLELAAQAFGAPARYFGDS